MLNISNMYAVLMFKPFLPMADFMVVIFGTTSLSACFPICLISHICQQFVDLRVFCTAPEEFNWNKCCAKNHWTYLWQAAGF
jgi:hypothetical protein